MRWLLKRWWFWAGTGFMLVAVCVGYLLIPVGEGGISQANCDRIQLGWTMEEVVSLLGENDFGGIDSVGGFEMPWKWSAWLDEDGNRINVTFSDEGVATKHFVASGLSIYERMKRRIERRIRALWR
jgi:hypothetical protein